MTTFQCVRQDVAPKGAGNGSGSSGQLGVGPDGSGQGTVEHFQVCVLHWGVRRPPGEARDAARAAAAGVDGGGSVGPGRDDSTDAGSDVSVD